MILVIRCFFGRVGAPCATAAVGCGGLEAVEVWV